MQQLNQDARQLQDMKEIGEKWDAEEQGLQPGDYCDASKDMADELTAMGLPTLSKYSLTSIYRFILWDDCTLQNSNGVFALTKLDAPTFLSRARVTAKELGLKPVDLAAEEAKRKEAERAEKLSKLKFGVRVMTPDGEGIFHEYSAGVGHWVIFPYGTRNFTLDEITILP
jgi:hypothetical protein